MNSNRSYQWTPLAARLTIIVPAFNEQAGIGAALRSLQNEPRLDGATIIVVDDGSTDDTADIAAASHVTVLRNRTNRGYGASLKRALRTADTEYVAWFDADGQHRASDLADMLERIVADNYDAVIGARGGDSHVHKGRRFGKQVIHRAAETAVGSKIPDVNCGLRVFRRDVLLRYVHLLPDGFSASTTSTLVVIQRNYNIAFHPVLVSERIGQSTVNQIRDGLRALHTILRILILFRALRTFTLLASVFLLIGFGYGIPMALKQGLGFPVLASLFVVSGIQIFCLGVVCDQISAMRLERLESAAEPRGEQELDRIIRSAA